MLRKEVSYEQVYEIIVLKGAIIIYKLMTGLVVSYFCLSKYYWYD